MAVIENGHTRLTYDEYIHFPDDGRIHELIEGEHHVSPAPGTRHQTISRRIQFQLIRQLEIPGSADVFNAPTDVQLGKINVVQPDIAVIDRRRSYIISPRKINEAPDLVIEILSESTAARDHTLKLYLYQEAGVGEYWIVDPESNSVTSFKLTSEGTYCRSDPVSRSIEFRTEHLYALVDLTEVW